MKVALGTVEIDDEQRKAIRRDMGKSGHATRADAKEYLLAAVDNAIKTAGEGRIQAMTGSAVPEGQDTLPEPTAGGTATATTTGTTATTGGDTGPTTGNLGSAGTPGGTTY